MSRYAIRVNEHAGIYDIALGARPVPYSRIRGSERTIVPIEHLMGWGRWTWAIKTGHGWFFVDGPGEPKEQHLEIDASC